MKKWYRLRYDKIDIVGVIKETNEFVTLSCGTRFKKHPVDEHYIFFRSIADLKEYLSERTKDRIENVERNLEYAKDQVVKLTNTLNELQKSLPSDLAKIKELTDENLSEF